MPGCSVQSYGKVPAVLKVRDTERFVVVAISAGAPVFFAKMTLCASEGNSNVTDSPTLIVTAKGENEFGFMYTTAGVTGVGVTAAG